MRKTTLLLSFIAFVQLATAQAITDTTVIGTQVWTTKNLDVSTFNNGDKIPEVTSDEDWSTACQQGKAAWCYYKYKSANGKKFGKLYNWYAVIDPRGIAPKGWHIPTKDDLEYLIDYLDGSTAASKKLKSTTEWSPETSGNNVTGFNALPAGCFFYHDNSTVIFSSNQTTRIWSVTEQPGYTAAWELTLVGSDMANNMPQNKGNGFSVRCVREFHSGIKSPEVGSAEWFAADTIIISFKGADQLSQVTSANDKLKLMQGKWIEFLDKDYNLTTPVKAKYYRLSYYKSGLKNGIDMVCYVNGILYSKSMYANGMVNGAAITYYKNGKIQDEYTCFAGEKTGIEKSYYEDGKLKAEYPFIDGKENGVSKDYYESGLLRNEFTFKDDKHAGVWKEYWPNGNIQSESTDEAGKDTWEKDYDKSGKLAYTVTWPNGVRTEVYNEDKSTANSNNQGFWNTLNNSLTVLNTTLEQASTAVSEATQSKSINNNNSPLASSSVSSTATAPLPAFSDSKGYKSGMDCSTVYTGPNADIVQKLISRTYKGQYDQPTVIPLYPCGQIDPLVASAATTAWAVVAEILSGKNQDDPTVQNDVNAMMSDLKSAKTLCNYSGAPSIQSSYSSSPCGTAYIFSCDDLRDPRF